MRESRYQHSISVRLERTFPGCVVIKGPSEHIQGIPDLLILYGDTWAALEVKRSASEPAQPNQVYYVNKFNEMSYASFIFPENEERVFDELSHAFGFSR
jgi:hypothetical protein